MSVSEDEPRLGVEVHHRVPAVRHAALADLAVLRALPPQVAQHGGGGGAGGQLRELEVRRGEQQQVPHPGLGAALEHGVAQGGLRTQPRAGQGVTLDTK